MDNLSLHFGDKPCNFLYSNGQSGQHLISQFLQFRQARLFCDSCKLHLFIVQAILKRFDEVLERDDRFIMSYMSLALFQSAILADKTTAGTSWFHADEVELLLGVFGAEDIIEIFAGFHQRLYRYSFTNTIKLIKVHCQIVRAINQMKINAITTGQDQLLQLQNQTIKLKMIDYRSKLLGYSSRPTQRADEWTLINQHKSLEEEKAKIQEQRLEEQKKRQLAQILEMQIREKNSKELALRNEEQYYADITERQVREAKEENELKRRMHIQKRREMETHNKELFNGIVESKIREPVYPTPTSIDIGTNTQLQRKMMVNSQRRGMIDELDRQIHQKQREKIQSKLDQYKIDQANLSYQLNRFDVRDKSLHSRHFGQNPYVYQYYQQIKQQQKEKQREFERLQIEQAARRKQEEQINKINEKNMNKKYLTTKMKEVLEEQMKIKDYQRYQEEKVNPEELSYGTIGRMLSQKRHQPNKQEYFEDLKRQIQEKQKRKEAEKFMNQEEYKINLNQLNRAIEGNYASKNYVDRSIHALSDSHKVNVSMIDAHLESRPQAEIARKNLEEIKARRQKLSLSMMDRPSASNF